MPAATTKYTAVTDRGAMSTFATKRDATRWADHPALTRQWFGIFRRPAHDPEAMIATGGARRLSVPRGSLQIRCAALVRQAPVE